MMRDQEEHIEHVISGLVSEVELLKESVKRLRAEKISLLNSIGRMSIGTDIDRMGVVHEPCVVRLADRLKILENRIMQRSVSDIIEKEAAERMKMLLGGKFPCNEGETK